MFQATVDTEEIYVVCYLGLQEEYLTAKDARDRIAELQKIDPTMKDHDFKLVYKCLLPIREKAGRKSFWSKV